MAVSAISANASDQNKPKQNLGVRVMNGKIYDSEKGRNCHQCRQKTRSFAAACKSERNGKSCPLVFCHSCLKNRYGEHAEEVDVLEQWSCPRCRGICNCSLCRKKQGHLPTGILLHRAKATGFSSVSELLHVNGPENFGLVKNLEDTVASPKQQSTSKKDTVIASPRKKGKENSFDNIKSKESGEVQNKILKNDGLSECSPCPEKKPRKMKQGTSKLYADKKDVAISEGVSLSCPDKKPKKMKQGTSKLYADKKDVFLKEKGLHVNKKAKRIRSQEDLSNMHDGGIDSAALLKSCPKKPQISDVKGHSDLVVRDDCVTKVSIEVPVKSLKNKKRRANQDIEEPAQKKSKNGVKQDIVNNNRNIEVPVESLKNKKGGANKDIEGPAQKKSKNGVKQDIVNNSLNNMLSESRDLGVDTPLPFGTELTTIDGVELPLQDVGNALQFLEFCAAFGKALNMKKGQSSIILQELLNGPSRLLRRSQQNSAVIKFHIQLLSLLQDESERRPQILSPSHGKNSWLRALKKCISESPNAIDSLPIDDLDGESGGYNTLDFSTKLRLLVFLCDEVLETERIRDWIHDQEIEFAKKAKEAKERFPGAKEKEKSLKQNIMNEVAKTIVAKDGDALTAAEHEEIIRQIKAEAAQAHREKLESLNLIPKTKERAAAVRTEPIFLDVGGRAFWRLNGYSNKSNILVQDIGNGDDSIASGEKWVAYDDEQEKMVKKHFSFRMLRAQTVAEIVPSQTNV